MSSGSVSVVHTDDSDEHGRYPAGTFLLNPDGSEHAPFSPEGCTLFVKLRQTPGPRERRLIDTTSEPWRPHHVSGVERIELYADQRYPERIHLTRVSAGVSVGPIHFPAGEEILVLAGSLEDEYGVHPRRSWLRFAPGTSHTLFTATGCTLYVKQGHLSGSPSA
jgi:anti-sigma factor ChrR (cupin superfamily)